MLPQISSCKDTDILIIVCSDNSNIAGIPHNNVRRGFKRVGITRAALERIPTLTDFFNNHRQLENRLEEIAFPHEPHICLVLLERYLTKGPDRFNAKHIKSLIAGGFSHIERFCILLRLIKLAVALDLDTLKDIAYGMLKNCEDLINGPNMITISRLVFGKNNGFEELFWLKKWAVGMMAKRLPFLQSSKQFELVVQNAAPVLAEKWARLCQLNRLGLPLQYLLRVDGRINDYDIAKPAHNGKSPRRPLINEGLPYAHPGGPHPTNRASIVQEMLADPHHAATRESGNAHEDHGEHGPGDSNTEDHEDLGHTEQRDEEKDDHEANTRAVTALELAVDKFFIAEGFQSIPENDDSTDIVQGTTAGDHSESSATGSGLQNRASQPSIGDHQVFSSETTAFNGQDSNSDTEAKPLDTTSILPSTRYSPFDHAESTASAVAEPNHSHDDDTAPTCCEQSNDGRQAQVAPRGVIIPQNIQLEDSTDRWPLPSNTLPPMNFPPKNGVKDKNEDCKHNSNNDLEDHDFTIEAARAVPIVGRFQGGNLIYHEPSSSKARQSPAAEDNSVKARKVMGLDQPSGPPGGSMAGDSTRIDTKKKLQKKGGFFSKK